MDAQRHEPRGRRLGRFELESELGRGGMGVVYRARDAESGQTVALKVVLAGRALTERDVKRLRHEALLAGRVNHPGVVSVLDAGVVEGYPFVAMALAPGVPLSALTKQLTLEEQARILARVARAVGAAHRVSVVHRDLKPSNILVDPVTHDPVVVDFGLAFDASFELSRVSRTGEVVGTPAYMAPETVAGDARPGDPRLDVYALGLMLFTAVLGEHPFARGGSLETIQQIVKGPPLVPRGADVELGTIARRACALDRSERPPDGDAFAAELEECLERRRRVNPAKESAPPLLRGRRPLLVGVAGLGLALLVGGAVLLLRRGEPPSPPPPTRPPPERHVPLVPPRQPRLLPPDEAALLDDDMSVSLDSGETSDESVLRARGEAQQRVMDRAASLVEKWPDDGRARIALALLRAQDVGLEHEVRRDMVRALRGTPPPPPWALEVAARLSHQLGFERAAADTLEGAFAGGATPAPERGFFLVQLYVKALPPVSNPRRAEELARRLLAKKTSAEVDKSPDVGTLHGIIGQARIGLGDRDGAAEEFAIASTFTHTPGPRAAMLEVARMTRDGKIPRGAMGRTVKLRMTTTAFLRKIADLVDQGVDDPGAAASELERLAAIEEGALRPEHAALAWLLAARCRDAEDRPVLRQAALERASRLPLDDAPDTRALIARAFAASLLLDKDAARAEEVALLSVEPVRGFDPRTRGELADGWLLVARAREASGSTARALEALGEARKLAPPDPRELEEIAARLAGR